MNNPLKSIVIRGDINSTEIKYKLCQEYLQLPIGIWEVSIGDIAFFCTRPIESNSIFEISSNVVQGHSFSITRRLCKENIILSTFLLNSEYRRANIKTPQILKWFVVNNVPSEYLSVYVNEWPSVNESSYEVGHVLISVNVLFRRII